MSPLRIRLQEAWREPGLQSYVVERDYLLSWVLAGISAVPELRETLVFKGGTALKKCYFEDYRFSEDLDFSGLVEAPTEDALADAMDRACDVARDLLAEYAQVEMDCERHFENNPHPGGQDAFRIRVRLPWHTRPDISIKVEITTDEHLLWPVERRKVMHGYGEALDAELQVYSPTEMVSEKLRAIRQQLERLETRGWVRNRARDYYDLWRILGAYRDQLDLVDFRDRLHEKCRSRNVDFNDAGDFFDPRIVDDVERGWDDSLGRLMIDLPAFATVMGELRPQIADLIAHRQSFREV